jgi:uncharacterized protein with HEPN domain
MKGIQFVTDDTGKRTAVLISLEEWGEAWEDIYDILVSEARKKEPTVSWEELKAEMAREREVRGTVQS